MLRVLAVAVVLSAAAMCLAAPAADNLKLQLIQLKCVKQQELTPDSPYLKVEGKKVAGPFKMTKGSVRDLSSVPPIPFDGDSIRVELWEADVDPDDFLGEQVIRSDRVGVKRIVLFTEDGAHYELTYKVVR